MRTFWTAVFLLALAQECTGAGSTPRKPAPKPISPAAYADAVAGLDDCDDFAARAAMLPDAAPLLASALTGKQSAAKDEFETSAQYNARQADFWRARVGDPQRMVIRVPIEPYKVSYDADGGVASVKYLADWYVRDQLLTFLDRDLARSNYVGTNAFGVSVDVTAVRALQGRLSFPVGQLSGDEGGAVSPVWKVALSPAEARAFKERPLLVLLASLEPPYVEEGSSYVDATIDQPTSLSIQKKTVHVRLRCGLFMTGAGTVVRSGLVSPPGIGAE